MLCEKPLSMSVAEAQEMVDLAAAKNLPNCVNHNLRFYPVVQQIRRMIEAGDLGDILVVQGRTRRIGCSTTRTTTGASRKPRTAPSASSATSGRIGWIWSNTSPDLEITALCADLQIVHKTRKKPKKAIQTFAGKTLRPEDYEEVPIETEDFGAVLVHLGDRARGAYTVSQVNAGLQEPVSDGDLRNKVRCDLEPGAAGRTLDRPSQLAEPDPS